MSTYVQKINILICSLLKDDGDKNVHSSKTCTDQQRLDDELQMSVSYLGDSKLLRTKIDKMKCLNLILQLLIIVTTAFAYETIEILMYPCLLQ